jgi:cation diffusion facilitator family transporter
MEGGNPDGNVYSWRHGQDDACGRFEANEKRTRAVIALTACMMVMEIAAGYVFGSMALLADGWHMASHAAALSITAMGYYFARRFAGDRRFSFGTGKMGDLAGFSSALLLAAIALGIAWESAWRLARPVGISFGEATAVAVLGLVVNVASALLLKEEHGHEEGEEHGHEDHNLKAAYLHVAADALTSVLAIEALVLGRYFGWTFLDPLMGIAGAVIITRWAYGLALETGGVLLDMTPRSGLAGRIRDVVENGTEARVEDLHVWRLGPGRYSLILGLSARQGGSPGDFKALLAGFPELAHVTVEVNTRE